MKHCFQRQLQRIEARIPQSSLQKSKNKFPLDKVLRLSQPKIWEWILSIKPEKVEEIMRSPHESNDDHERNILKLADLLALTRGWYRVCIEVNKYNWGFSLYTGNKLYKKEQDDWSLLYLMGLTPAQFAEISSEKREDILAEARKRVETRFQELGPETIRSFRQPQELFQAIRNLNLPELYNTSM